MAFFSNYEEISKQFVNQYYQIFDDPNLRPTLANFYQDQKSLMTFEGQQLMGKQKIIEKLTSLSFQSIKHIVTQVDAQPTFDNGIVVSVLGQLKTDDDHPHTFNQIFIIKQEGTAFYIEHDIFRLALHI